MFLVTKKQRRILIVMINNFCRTSRIERSGSTREIMIDDADFTVDVDHGLGDVVLLWS